MQTGNQTNTSSLNFHRPDALPDAQPTVSKHGRTPLLNRHTHTRLTALFWDYPGELVPERQKPIWILLKQETLSGSGISWAICESAPRSRQTTMPAPHHSVFYKLDALPAPKQQCQSTEVPLLNRTIYNILQKLNLTRQCDFVNTNKSLAEFGLTLVTFFQQLNE